MASRKAYSTCTAKGSTGCWSMFKSGAVFSSSKLKRALVTILSTYISRVGLVPIRLRFTESAAFGRVKRSSATRWMKRSTLLFLGVARPVRRSRWSVCVWAFARGLMPGQRSQYHLLQHFVERLHSVDNSQPWPNSLIGRTNSEPR